MESWQLWACISRLLSNAGLLLCSDVLAVQMLMTDALGRRMGRLTSCSRSQGIKLDCFLLENCKWRMGLLGEICGIWSEAQYCFGKRMEGRLQRTLLKLDVQPLSHSPNKGRDTTLWATG